MQCLKHEELTFTVCRSCDELEGTWKLPRFYYKQALKTFDADPSLCSSMNEDNTHLDEFAFIASSQLLNVAHELILWNWSLLFAWPQHGQGCSRQRKREGALTKMKRYWDMSKGHAVVKNSYYRVIFCGELWHWQLFHVLFWTTQPCKHNESQFGMRYEYNNIVCLKDNNTSTEYALS